MLCVLGQARAEEGGKEPSYMRRRFLDAGAKMVWHPPLPECGRERAREKARERGRERESKRERGEERNRVEREGAEEGGKERCHVRRRVMDAGAKTVWNPLRESG